MAKPSVISLCYYLLASLTGVAVVALALETDATYANLFAHFSPEMRTGAAIDALLEKLSLGLYAGAETERQNIAASSARVLWLRTWGNYLSLAFLALLNLRAQPRERLTQHLFLIAAMCLFVGLAAPMLSIVAQRDVAVLGQVILRFESKAILQTVATLANREQWLIAGALALFSVVLPCLKLCLGLITVIADSRLQKRSVHALHAISRWSMTDVFVVAVLLAFMAGEAGDSTNAWVGHGLWFFASYAMLSWWATHRLSRRDELGSEPGSDNLRN